MNTRSEAVLLVLAIGETRTVALFPSLPVNVQVSALRDWAVNDAREEANKKLVEHWDVI